MKIYGRMMALAAGFNAFYSLTALLITMRSVPHGTLFYYFTDSPLVLYAPQLVQQLCLHLIFATFYVHAWLPAIQFFIRYKVIKDSNGDLRKLYTSFFALVLFCCAYSSSYAIDFEEPSKRYRELLYSNVPGCDLDQVLPTYSVFNKALLPFMFIVLPNSLFLANIFPLNVMDTVGLIANFGSTMSPLLDALIVLFLIPAFRKNVVKSLNGTTPRSSNVIFTT
ncbi:unnamed protein product [Bursaphelenchus xylophilus]|uniref:(pine wood nematode) hypothetical protein n=1 Tax=Bursaphelenchus xylophilus TaxID=6326 RepID=A0A1I7RW06_BURXY|nr:unnamed protein product [Bursaphelenchus xylophilus]CAG9094970.1 unnamed protein product [Bursaphelenchus xylophilus]